MGYFYEKYQRFELVLVIVKQKIGPILSNFWERFFYVFQGKKFQILWKYCSVLTKKLHKMKLKMFLKIQSWILNRLILKFSNLRVLHKCLLMQDWAFRLWLLLAPPDFVTFHRIWPHCTVGAEVQCSHFLSIRCIC